MAVVGSVHELQCLYVSEKAVGPQVDSVRVFAHVYVCVYV